MISTVKIIFHCFSISILFMYEYYKIFVPRLKVSKIFLTVHDTVESDSAVSLSLFY